jgi:ubiquinol-cytochrome c reductase cytochrome b subunit
MANPLVTPAHIVPEWYFLPFYAILRSIPDKLGGVVAMFASILILLALPKLNLSWFRSAKFRPLFAPLYWFLVSDFLLLGWLGQKPVESPYIEIGFICTMFYFCIFLIFFPLLGLIETFLFSYKNKSN